MGIYDEKLYVKNKKGKFELVERKIVRAPHDIGRWKRNTEIEARNGLDHTVLQVENARGGLNKKVVKMSTSLGKNEKVVRSLITTSNKLSKRDLAVYKGVKGYNNPIKRG